MAYVYLSGRGLQGLLVALRAPPLPLAVLGSSGAALARLALQLGGARALRLLLSEEYVQLLKGYGPAAERGRLARSWLARLGVPAAALLADLAALGGLPCTLALLDVERQLPTLVCSHRPCGAVRLAELVPALCSLVPSPLGARHVVDLEHVLPPQCLAAALRPPPLLLAAASEPSLAGPAALRFSASLASLQERLLCRGGCAAAPVFRCRVPHLLETTLSSGASRRTCLDRGGERPASTAAALLVYVWACLLDGLGRSWALTARP
jgi:hypothetical protein